MQVMVQWCSKPPVTSGSYLAPSFSNCAAAPPGCRELSDVVAEMKSLGKTADEIRATLKEKGYKKARISKLMKTVGDSDRRGDGASRDHEDWN